jgi:mannose-6-phosphate isomerase-like protein (cupin superfamily)
MQENKVVAVEDVLSAVGQEAHGNCAKAVLHQAPAAETSLFKVNPGEVLAAHSHPETWDLFFGISGQGEIAYEGEAGSGVVPIGPRSFCAMPPGCRHEVRNRSRSEHFSFLLIHAPWDGYQFVRTGAKISASTSA